MLPTRGLPGAERRRRKRTPLLAQTAELVGASVEAAIPLHERRPDLILVLGVLEILLFVALLVTFSPFVLLALVVVTLAYLGLVLADGRRVLALTPAGGVVLVAGRNGRPLAPVGPAPRDLRLPSATGLCAAVDLDDGRWWIDRAAYRQLKAALAASTEP